MPTSLTHTMQNVSHLSEYFGVWAIQSEPFMGMVEHAKHFDLSAHMNAQPDESVVARDSIGYDRQGNAAVINLSGTLMKQVSSFSGGTSTVRARQSIRAAVADESVTRIILRIDSPGGTVAGTKELGDEVKKASMSKPVIAVIEDLGASAAYWVASQADEIYANEAAMVGSIGTLLVLQELADLAEREGIKVHLFATGDYKGAGTPGTRFTDEQLSYWQSRVNDLNSLFLTAVSKGRGMTKSAVNEVADGRVHIAKAAKDLGLIDGIKTLEEVLGMSRGGRGSRTRSEEREPEMSETQTPAAATIKEIEAACPKAEPNFILDCARQGMTLSQVQDLYRQNLEAQLEMRDSELSHLQSVKDRSTATASRGGVSMSSSDSSDSTAESEFDAMLEAKDRKGMERAIRNDPEGYAEWLASYNKRFGRHKAVAHQLGK